MVFKMHQYTSYSGQGTDTEETTPVLLTVIFQQLPLGDFKITPVPTDSNATSPFLTCNFAFGLSVPIPTLFELF